MKALILWNDSYLNSHDIETINADRFYCLFNITNLYTETDDHFFVDTKDITQNLNLRRSLLTSNIKQVVFYSKDFPEIDIKGSFENLDIQFKYLNKGVK